MAKSKGVFKRGDTFWIRYSANGKQIRESTFSKRKEDAHGLLISRLHDIKEGKLPELRKLPDISFKELAERYTNYIQGRNKSAKTKGYIIGQLLSMYADKKLKDFNTELIEVLQSDLIKKEYKPASNNKITNIIKHMFKKACEWNLVSEDVLKNIRKVKPLKDTGGRLRYLSTLECKNLLSVCDAHLMPVVITALNTGMRKGEILSLKWDSVDLRHNRILLEKTKNGKRREIPINNTLRETLQGIPRRLDIPFVFYDPVTEKPYKDVKTSFNTALKRTGITDFHFHDLRHTFASHLVMSGVDITTVSKLLGHQTLTMTLRYSHLSSGHLDNAVSMLDKILNTNTISTKLAQLG